MGNEQAGLFGLKNTNRDFNTKEAWGKNQFNSALCCYLAHKGLAANYLCIQNGIFQPTSIAIKDIFGISPESQDLYFAFEAQYSPYQKYVLGTLPRVDLVVQKESTGECLAGLEVKLTALPDNTTCLLDESHYGCELVIRPDSIVYLACSIAASLDVDIKSQIPLIKIEDWSDANQVFQHLNMIIGSLRQLALQLECKQKPFLLQPIWKTQGKSPKLAESCLDVFTWSDAGFVYFISKIANQNATSITRQNRTAIWLFKMLMDIAQYKKFDHGKIIDFLSFNTKNDKAFASSGNITNPYMSCLRLEQPAIKKSEIKHIILGGGQNLLNPERRFDAIIYNSPELF